MSVDTPYQWQPPFSMQPLMPPAPPSAIPVQPAEYHQVWRAPAYRWWKGLVVLLTSSLMAFVVSMLLAIPLIWRIIQNPQEANNLRTTPLDFTLNNVGIAGWIPVALLMSWALTGQRPGWLMSVTGRMRWSWLWRCAGLVAVVWIPFNLLDYAMAWLDGKNPFAEWAINPSTNFLIASILLTTVFQSAGEEIFIRGLVTRAIGSWIPHRVVGLVAAALVSAGVFVLLHGAGDPWLNIAYALFALTASWLTWRTGGLEAAIALHAINNLLAEVSMPFTDIGGMFERGAGTADPWVLIEIPFLAAVVALVEWRARRDQIARVTANV